MKKLTVWGLGLLLFLQLSCKESPQSNAPLRVRMSNDPESLHPINYGNAVSLEVINLIYQSLLTVDLKDKSIQPLLVDDLPHVKRKDSLAYYTYHLRSEAKWDDGTPVTSKDVAFTLKVMHSPQMDNEQVRAQYDFITDIQLTDKDSLTFTLVCKDYSPEQLLLTGDFFILPAHKLDPRNSLEKLTLGTIKGKYDSLSTSPTIAEVAKTIQQPTFARDTAWVKGSGPYKLVNWSTGQHLFLQKKKNWWGDKVQESSVLKAKPQQIYYQIIPDDAAAVLALKAGQLDFMDEIPLKAYQAMEKDPTVKQKFHFYSPSTYDVVFMGINGFKKSLQDKRTRQALTYLLDVPQVVKSLYGGLATATVGFVHPTEKQFYNASLNPLSLNLAKAEQLLLAAGWKHTSGSWQKSIDGKLITLELEFVFRAGNAEFENMALLFQQNAKKINIPVKLVSLEGSQVSQKLSSHQYDVYFRTLTGNPFSYNLAPLLHTSSAQNGGPNNTNFGTPETDALLEKINTTEDIPTKAKYVKQLQQKMQEESNIVFLYFQQNRIAVSNKIESVVTANLKPGYDLTKFTFKK